MKTAALVLLLSVTTACGVETSTPESSPLVASGPSVCVFPQTGGFGSRCQGDTPRSQAWVWVEPSPDSLSANDGGEITHRCNEVVCPSGATCLAQNVTSTGTYLMM